MDCPRQHPVPPLGRLRDRPAAYRHVFEPMNCDVRIYYSLYKGLHSLQGYDTLVRYEKRNK
jgi:hypothetical protein